MKMKLWKKAAGLIKGPEQHMGGQHLQTDLVPEPGSRGHHHQGHQPRRNPRRLQELPQSLPMGAHISSLPQAPPLGSLYPHGQDSLLGCRSQRPHAHARHFLLQNPIRSEDWQAAF
ncbi:hypothetical protein Pyn_27285 [Prunus yedoensis var. nudiflora]|uniref:Uncharacterized protein n=1 Tax=Prunus yedoensis var. nudiflora TaxID=2094558 RepID=A0A314XLR5_PRUYE|nr:hypothetical protein Pyn_27285 [Prunus yedoensis var. nudiflora]